VDVNQIRELIKVVEASDISEIVIEEGDAKVTVRRGGAAAVPAASAPAVAPTTPASAAPAEVAAPAAGGRPATWKTVTAPMVGTFYEAPAPGSPAFVTAGDSFAEGQPLCILEAMKLMNEIVAEEAGVIREIGVKNGDAVDYGTVLFYYEPV
jgi:oxaloacetate decarboxylase (Na+ extruding) subunit alpha